MSSANKIEKLSELRAAVDPGCPARARLASLFDEGSFVELDAFVKAENGEAGVVAGYGTVEGGMVYAFSQDVTADKGAVSVAHAKKIKKVYSLAAKTGCPVVCIYDSNGAKLSEGGDMLNAYSQMLLWSNNLSGVVPQIAVVLGTCAGVAAMLAAGADYLIMSKDAELFLTAPFVSSANGYDTENAGTAEAAAEAGVASLVCEDEGAALAETRRLLTMLPQNNLASLPFFDFAEPAEAFDPEGCPKLVVEGIADADSLVELDAGYANGVYTWLGTMAGVTTAFVATSSKNPLDADACAKAARFVKTCDAFNIPVVTLLNSVGFALDSDIKLVKEAAKLASAYAEATTAKISVITGKAYGAAYIALGSKNSNADVTLAWPQAEISALPTETAVEFLWEDRFAGTTDVNATRAALREEYADTVASPFEAAKNGFIEEVIAPEETRRAVIGLLEVLAGKRETKLPKKHVTL